MIKTVFAILIFLVSCSSLPDKVYKRSAIEKRADQLMKAADISRNERRYIAAKEYYLSAAELYRGKADHQKYLISQIRLADLALITKSFSDFNALLIHIIDVNQMEKLNQASSVDYLKAKRLYIDKKNDQANKIVDGLINKFEDDEEKFVYYTFLKAEHNLSGSNSDRLDDLYNDLIDLFEDGELNNLAILTYCSLVRAKLAVELNHVSSIDKLKTAEQLFKQLEHISKLEDLYGLFSDYYSKNNQLKLADYYRLRETETKKLLN